MLDLGLSLDLWPWLWLAVAAVFVLLELTVLGGSLMVLPFGVSAFFAALLGFGDVAIEVQWSVFVFGGLGLFLLFWRYQSLVQRGNELPPGVGAVRLVGLTGVVTRDVRPGTTEPGQVAVGGETWGALTGGQSVLPEGTRVRVVDVEGTRVRVEPVEPRPPDPPVEAST
jgi:membrane protein implicated in regulation of membrane protease activity